MSVEMEISRDSDETVHRAVSRGGEDFCAREKVVAKEGYFERVRLKKVSGCNLSEMCEK